MTNPAGCDATALLRWRSPVSGGRRSGPPLGPTYAATVVFALGDDQAAAPSVPPDLAEHLSAVFGFDAPPTHEPATARVRFLTRDRVDLSVGAPFLVMEGPRPVADGTITSVVEDAPVD